LERIASSAEVKKPKDKSEYEEAIKTTGKALLETGTGKQLKEQSKEYLLSKKGAPIPLTLGAGVLAAIIANKAEIPSIPISLSENMELTLMSRALWPYRRGVWPPSHLSSNSMRSPERKTRRA
jgi:hypothetical protein